MEAQLIASIFFFSKAFNYNTQNDALLAATLQGSICKKI